MKQRALAMAAALQDHHWPGLRLQRLRRRNAEIALERLEGEGHGRVGVETAVLDARCAKRGKRNDIASTAKGRKRWNL